MQEMIKEHDQDIQFACTQASAISEESHVTGHYSIWRISSLIETLLWYICRVKEAILIRLQPNNITRDSGIEIPDGWMPTIKNSHGTTVQCCGNNQMSRRWGYQNTPVEHKYNTVELVDDQATSSPVED